MTKKIKYGLILLIGSSIIFSSCKKDPVINPYDNLIRVDNSNPNILTIPNSNFAWIQAKIFKPTCANSGCHDGTFEPNFNTISSSYNTIINQSVISNDINNSFNFRVKPGDSDNSLMYARMITEFPNTSGMMPAVVDPGSDWGQNMNNYLNIIETWIDNGAKDMYGNDAPSSTADFPPQVTGLVVFPQGNTTTPYERDLEQVEITPILVEATQIDIWIYVTDDNTAPNSMDNNYIKASQDITNFEEAITADYSVNSPLIANDFFNNSVGFLHKATLDLNGYQSGDTFFLRNVLDDSVQENFTELPNAGSNAVITSYFVIKIQ